MGTWPQGMGQVTDTGRPISHGKPFCGINIGIVIKSMGDDHLFRDKTTGATEAFALGIIGMELALCLDIASKESGTRRQPSYLGTYPDGRDNMFHFVYTPGSGMGTGRDGALLGLDLETWNIRTGPDCI